MSRAIWHLVDAQTGIGCGISFTGFEGEAMMNTPPGMVPARTDVFDHLSQRVEFFTDDFGDQQPRLMDYQPPAPPDSDLQTWAWDPESKRWIASPTVAGRKPALLAALERQMLAIEAQQQGRPLRELLLALAAGQTPNTTAVERLQATEADLAALRTKYAAVTAATTYEQLDEVSL